VSARQKLLANSSSSLSSFIRQTVWVSLVVIGVYLIQDGQLTMGGLIACTMLFARAMAPILQVFSLTYRYQDTVLALKTLDAMVSKESERPDGVHFVSRGDIKGDIEFKHVFFDYPQSQQNALRGISLSIKAGEKVGILGRSGSGKSTILKLAMGLYRPISGSVLIDGIDVRQLDPTELRSHCGYVAQDVNLFFGSLRDNISLGSRQVEDKQIVEAARRAHITEFVNRHPMGFDMPIGERGDTLSGGQKQGVAIARALLHSPPILLLDEPTSALDTSSEETVKQQLKTHLANSTMIIVTHRTSLLELVDRIVVIDNGTIVADGEKADVIQALKQGRVGKAQ
jgi:ATP-binding cassette subfamily C protein LapB